ncbi:MAG: hypothetical protein ACT4PO_01790 [Actinomycetota bacterium]
MGRAIDPCGAEYRAVDLLMRACGRPLGHGGHHFVHALPLEPVPDGLEPLGPVLDRAALPEPGTTGLVVFSADQWRALGRALAASEEARERDVEDRLKESREWIEESWDLADAAIADAAARGEL